MLRPYEYSCYLRIVGLGKKSWTMIRNPQKTGSPPKYNQFFFLGDVQNVIQICSYFSLIPLTERPKTWRSSETTTASLYSIYVRRPIPVNHLRLSTCIYQHQGQLRLPSFRSIDKPSKLTGLSGCVKHNLKHA